MSSVIYINLSLVILSFNKLLNNNIFLYLNFFHSFSSLLLFMISGILNLLTNSRMMIFNNSLSKFYSLFNLILFLIFFFRINRPMNLRFFREIYFFVFILNLNLFLFYLIIFFLFVIIFYIIIFYINLSFGYKIYFFNNFIFKFNILIIFLIYFVIFFLIFIKLENLII